MKSYSVKCFAEGKGKPSIARFATLAEAQTYVENRWCGVEYCHGTNSFHTDYSEYTLHGFTLKDIGTFSFSDGCREFVFNPISAK